MKNRLYFVYNINDSIKQFSNRFSKSHNFSEKNQEKMRRTVSLYVDILLSFLVISRVILISFDQYFLSCKVTHLFRCHVVLYR